VNRQEQLWKHSLLRKFTLYISNLTAEQRESTSARQRNHENRPVRKKQPGQINPSLTFATTDFDVK
jgi:hypothetical protein